MEAVLLNGFDSIGDSGWGADVAEVVVIIVVLVVIYNAGSC